MIGKATAYKELQESDVGFIISLSFLGIVYLIR